MAQFETWLEADLQKMIKPQMLNGTVFSADNMANLVGVKVYNGGAPATLGGSVTGKVIRADGATVPVSGTLSGNAASIVLPQAAYAVIGPITISIAVTDGGATTTLACAVGVVTRTSTDTTVDPGTIIPSIDALIAQINAAINSIPADYSALLAAIAPTFSASAAYPAGAYVWQGGTLYRFTAAHAAGSWTGTDAAEAVVGNDVADLRSAITDMDVTSILGYPLYDGHISGSGTWGQTGQYKYFVVAFPVSGGDTIAFESKKQTRVAFVTDFVKPVYGESLIFSEQAGYTSFFEVAANTLLQFIAPSDAKYMVVERVLNSVDVDIKVLTKNGYDYTSSLDEQVVSIKNGLEGYALGLVDKNTFVLGKTFDSNGLPVDAYNRAITDFIKCSGGDVIVIVPNDGSVKTNLYVYDANKTHLMHGVYNNNSRIVQNTNAVYVRFVIAYNNDSIADEKLLNSVRIYNNVNRLTTQYRGNVIKLGHTALVDCSDDGYYSFSSADAPNISDLPYGTNVGGMVHTFKHYAGNVVYQLLYLANNAVFSRFGDKPFLQINQNGSPIIPTWEPGAINQTTGVDADSSNRIRSNGKILIGEGVKIIVPAEMELSVIAYNNNDERIATTGLQQADFYHYPYLGESYFRVFGGYIDKRTTITVADGNKFGISYLPISADAPMWYALGDSITQGFYSEEGTAGIAGETPNNYPAYGAALMGWKLRNLGVGGSGYLKASTSLGLPNAKGQVDGINFAYCDICTLAYGVNDWHYNQEIGTVEDSKTLGTTMASNMKYVIEKILTDNPLCRLNIMLPLNCSTYGGTFETDWGLGTSLATSGTLQHVIDVIRGIAEMYHLPIIDQSAVGIANRFNINDVLPDGIHPALETMKPYGERIVKQIV